MLNIYVIKRRLHQQKKTKEEKTMNTNNKEQWKPIKGYDGFEVSNKGRVRNLNWNRTGQVRIMSLHPNPKT